MREKNIEKKCKDFVEKQLNGKFKKLQGMGNGGEPDRLIVLPEGLVVFCELKKPGQKPSALQHRKMKQLKKLGHYAFWADDFFVFKLHLGYCVGDHRTKMR